MKYLKYVLIIIFLFLGFSNHADAAPALVHTTAAVAESSSTSFNYTVTAGTSGNLVLFYITNNTTNATITSISGTHDGGWTKIQRYNDSGAETYTQEIWWAVLNSNSADVLSVSVTSPGDRQYVAAQEISGANTTSPTDGVNTGTATGTAPSINVTVGTTGDMLFGIISNPGGTLTYGAGSGFTSDENTTGRMFIEHSTSTVSSGSRAFGGSGCTSNTYHLIGVAIKAAASASTTLATGTDPSNATIAPGASITDAGAFTLATSSGTDSVTALTATLAGSGSPYAGVSQVSVTSDNGSTTYFSAVSTPGSNSVSFSGGTPIPVTTTPTQFKIRITPLSHANMPAVPGASYALSPYVSAFTSTNGQAGSDTNANTLTIDNLSPNGVTSTSGSAGNANVTLGWTGSNSSDISSSVVLRWAASSPGSEVPVEGSTYTAGNTISTATVACVLTTTASQVKSGIVDGTGGTTGCNTSALTNSTAYSYKIFSQDTSGNYDAGVTVTGGAFTPAFVGVTISGILFNTSTNNPILVADTVKISIAGAASAYVTSSASDGTFSFSNAPTPNAGDIINLWISGDASNQGSLVFRYGSSCTGYPNCTGLKIIKNNVSLNSFDGSNVTNSNLSACNNTSGTGCATTDLGFTSSGGAVTTSWATNTLNIPTGTTYAPGGNVTTQNMNVAGTYTGGSETLTLSGNFTNNGTFNRNSNTTTFSGTGTSVISGATTFNNFTISTAGKNVQFQHQTANAPIFTFAGTFTASTGSLGNLIMITSDTLGTQWIAHFNSAQTISYVYVRDSGCDTGTSNVTISTSQSGANNGSCWVGISNATFSGGSGHSTPPVDGGNGGGAPATGGTGENGGSGSSTPPVDGGNGGGTIQGGGTDEGGSGGQNTP